MQAIFSSESDSSISLEFNTIEKSEGLVCSIFFAIDIISSAATLALEVSALSVLRISPGLGEKIAKKTSNQAYDLLKIIGKGYSQEKAYPEIVKLDDKYKKNRLNPGTSADLLVAGLFVYKCFYDSKA